MLRLESVFPGRDSLVLAYRDSRTGHVSEFELDEDGAIMEEAASVAELLRAGMRRRMRANPRPPGRYNIAGEMLTVREIEKKYVIPQSVFYRRIGTGWDPERAAMEPIHDNPVYSVLGKEMTTTEITEKYGVSLEAFRYRRGRGWDVERAATEPVLDRYDIYGRMLSTAEIEKIYGVNRTAFYMRMRRGWGAERAATTPLKKS